MHLFICSKSKWFRIMYDVKLSFMWGGTTLISNQIWLSANKLQQWHSVNGTGTLLNTVHVDSSREMNA